MDKSDGDVSRAEVKPARTETVIIGNTTFTVNAYYCGKEPLEDILKRLILRDLEREEFR